MCRWGSRRDGIHACEELQIHPTCTHKQDYVDNTWPAPPQYLVMSGQMNNSPHILCCFWVSLTNFYINSVRPRLCSSFPLCGYYRLTSLDASFAQCFAFWRISSKTLAPMFFCRKINQKIALLRKRHNVLHDIFGFWNSIQRYDKILVT